MQIDFADPANLVITDTINAANRVKVDGLELDLTLLLAGVRLGAHYTYLDDDMPLQPNPLAGGALQHFEMAQTPRHAGSLTMDYRFAPNRYGTLTAHLDMTSTAEYAYVPTGFQLFDSYTLWNARLTLADINLGEGSGALTVSAWAKNLTDEEYVVWGYPLGVPPAAVTQAYGTPRTVGFDITYHL